MAYTPTNPNGQALMAASAPVVIASNQTVIPVSLTTLPALASGTNIVGKVGIDQTTPGTTNGVVALNNALVSTVNSSTVNIAASGTFIGTAEDASDYSHISVTIFSSHVSATDGLQLQHSHDGTNWDFTDMFTIPAATGKQFSAGVSAKFFRILYTNGATLTTSFRLQVIYSKATKKSSSIRALDARSVENDFEEMMAYIAGFNGTSWDRLRSTIANGLQVDVTRGAPDVTASGPLAAAAQVVTLPLTGQSAAAAQITGTWVGTITFEASLDGTTWTALNAVSASTSTPQTTTTVNGLYRITPGGLQQIRANMSAFTSGSASVLLRGSAGTGGTFINQLVSTKNTDGVSSQAIKAASTTAAFTDQAAVVDIRPGGILAGMGAVTTTGDTGAKTVTGNGATQINSGNKGVQIVIVLGAVTGTTPTAVFKVQTSVDGGTNWVDLTYATTASLTTTGTWGIIVYPGLQVVSGVATSGTSASGYGVLPRSWRIVWTIGGTTPSFTITSITYNYLPN